MILATTRALVQLFKSMEPNTHLSQGSIVELAKLPAIILTGPVVSEVLRRQRDAERITVIDENNRIAVHEKSPRWYNMQFGVALSCAANMDLLKLMESCSRLPQQYPVIKAVGEERTREYSWGWRSFPSAYPAPNASEVIEGRGELMVYDVEVYSDLRETVSLVEAFELGEIDVE